MRRFSKTLVTASAFAAAALAATALYADARRDGGRTMMGSGGMMGRGGMMGQMGGMMDHCNQMMGGSGSDRPNEQWRKDGPKTPEKKV